MHFLLLDPGSGIGTILCQLAQLKKNKIISYFMEFVATKKGYTTNFFLLLFCFVVGYKMDKNQDPGSVINIADPQHCKSDSALLLKPITTNIRY